MAKSNRQKANKHSFASKHSMTAYFPLVSVGGATKELPIGDTLDVNAFPVIPIAKGGTNASSFTSGQVTYFNGTALVGSGDLVFGSAILSVGAAAGSGEIRSYQIGGDVYYVAVKTASGKSGIFRSNTDFFCYYDTSTGQTVLDATFSGSPQILFKVLGTERARLDNSGVFSCGGDIVAGDTSAHGLVLQSPDTNDWRVTVNNSGVLVVTGI